MQERVELEDITATIRLPQSQLQGQPMATVADKSKEHREHVPAFATAASDRCVTNTQEDTDIFIQENANNNTIIKTKSGMKV